MTGGSASDVDGQASAAAASGIRGGDGRVEISGAGRRAADDSSTGIQAQSRRETGRPERGRAVGRRDEIVKRCVDDAGKIRGTVDDRRKLRCFVRINAALPVPNEFVALIVISLGPGVVGVPLITPVLASTLNPDGSPVAL